VIPILVHNSNLTESYTFAFPQFQSLPQASSSAQKTKAKKHQAQQKQHSTTTATNNINKSRPNTTITQQ